MSKQDAVGINTSEIGEKFLDLRVFVKELWRWKWIFLIAATIGAIIGVKNASEFIPTYEAKMLVQSVSGSNGVGFGQAEGSGILGVARSFGIGHNRANSSFDLLRVTIGSTVLARKIQKKHGLMQTIYKNSWDAEKNSWIKPNIDQNSYRQRLRRFFHLNPWHAPDIQGLANYLAGIVKLQQDGITDYFKLSVEHPDRKYALYLLDIVHREADELIGLRRHREQEERKRYLEQQIDTTRLGEIRSVLLSLLMQQEQRAIIVDANPPYLIKVIEPAHASVWAKEPSLIRIILVPIAIIIALVMVVVIVVVSFRNE